MIVERKNIRGLASRLRHRITLQQQVQMPDGGGGFARSWEDVAEVWAEILPAAAAEKFENLQLSSETRHRFIIRYRSGVTHAMRIAYEGRLFNIRAVINPEERNEVLEIVAEEGVAT